MLEHAFPASVVDAMARGDVLEIVDFAMIFGAACATIGAKAQPVLDVCKSLASAMFQYTDYVMWATPLGVFGAIASTVGEHGLQVLLGLGEIGRDAVGRGNLFRRCRVRSRGGARAHSRRTFHRRRA